MTFSIRHRRVLSAVATMSVLALAACDDSAPVAGPSGAVGFAATGDVPPPPPTHSSNWLVVCKEGPAGVYDFTASVQSTAPWFNPTGSPFTLVPGECKTVFVVLGDVPAVDPLSTVTVTELGTAPIDSIVVKIANDAPVTLSGTRVAVALVNYARGGSITFFNGIHLEPPPPPPPPAGQGCTPGYWKQTQHFSSWKSPYVPTGPGATDFDAAFGVNAFNPNITLLTALGLQGGGIQALARHAAAALLNTANSSVDYDMTSAEVIALVQAAIASGDYETAKNKLAALNEIGCPLN